jgi:plastocyanin
MFTTWLWRRRSFSVALGLLLVLSGATFWRANAAPASVAAQPALAVIEVDIAGFAFNPSPLVIQPNTTVRWTNRDLARHDVVGVMNASELRSPLLGQGESFEYTFTLPGTYNYICTLHAGMAGRVVVEDSGSYTFPETGYTVGGRFLAYWRAHGLEFGDYNISYRESLALFGNPIGNPFMERLGEREYEVQYFERARFEHHPENADPQYQVLLGQLGRIIRAADPPTAQQVGAIYFDETGHNLGGRFREYWEENGGLAVFGYPLSEEFMETLDGKPYRVQYFERVRFEYHPENQPPYDVLLGQFGREVLDR